MPGAATPPGSIVHVVLSAGAAPVKVPRLINQSAATARDILASLGLDSKVISVPAPGTAPGTVTQQSPASGTYVTEHTVVTLSIAEVPTWHPLTSLSGSKGASTVPFRTLGTRFRIVYDLSFGGLCSVISFLCSNPTPQVDLDKRTTVAQFELQNGGPQSVTVNAGAGLYEVAILPGSSSASWSLRVDDH